MFIGTHCNSKLFNEIYLTRVHNLIYMNTILNLISEFLRKNIYYCAGKTEAKNMNILF